MITCLWVGGTCLGTEKQSGTQNVLMIAIDDLKTIGSLYSDEPGNFLKRVYPDDDRRTQIAKRMTPNLTRLAARGVTFTNAHCAAPACNPSRAALMTGIRPHVSGLTTNAGGVFFRDYEINGGKPLENVTTLPQWLREHGWYTATTGKIFHTMGSYRQADGERSWSNWTNVPGSAGRKRRDPFSPKTLDWGVEGDRDSTYRDLNDYHKADFIADLIEFGHSADGDEKFSLPKNQPFFIACGLFRPHLPFYSTQDLLDLFPTEEMTIDQALLDEFMNDADDLPNAALRWCGLAVDEKGHPVIGRDRFVEILEHGKSIDPVDGKFLGWKRMLQHYFASCAIADRCVGRLLDGLDHSPYRDRTTVILWSDHGYHLGEKLHETKFTLWNDATNVNLVIADPQIKQGHGRKCEAAVSLLDLFPTVCGQSNLELPRQPIAGRDLASLLSNPNAHWPHSVICTYESVSNHMLIRGRYKLIRYDDRDDQIELYDLKNDPEEFINLAHQPEYKELVNELLIDLQQELRRGESRQSEQSVPRTTTN